jgi:N-dimethylarginine dimethylaminohydrolase
VTGDRRFGCVDMTGALRRVVVRAPSPESVAAWQAFGWHAEPDAARIAEEHEAFRAALADAGAEVVVAETPVPLSPDSIYVFDPALVTPGGAILLRPGKDGRRVEVDALAADLVEAGVPILGKLEAPATVEGGDTIWLDERTLLVGIGYRTNEAGAEALRRLLPGVEVHAFDLPHLHGEDEVLHLMSLLSPLDRDLAVAYLPYMPVRLVQLLRQRGIELVEVPDDEFWTMGPNVLALGPRIALALEGNDETRRRMEAADVDVRVYSGDELSRKGDGGPTCLTRPILRD